MTAIKCVCDAEDRCKFGDTHSVMGAEVPVFGVIWLRAGFSVVSGNESNERDVFLGKAENFTVEDDVLRVFLMGTGADEIATFVDDRSALE